MKKVFSIICALALSVQASFGFESIDEALKNGVSKGDVILYGNYVGLQKGGATAIGDESLGLAHYAYLGNLGYLMGNVGLSYTSGFYKNFRASIGFRAVASFYACTRWIFPTHWRQGRYKSRLFQPKSSCHRRILYRVF